MIKQMVIRLQRKGRFKKPCYDVVVIFKKHRVQGATLDKIGFYNPMYSNKIFFLSLERLAFWLYKGAYISPKVSYLLGKLAGGMKRRKINI